jgi:hypothetical protein
MSDLESDWEKEADETDRDDERPSKEESRRSRGRLYVDGTPFELFAIENGELLHFIAIDRRTCGHVEEAGRVLEWPTEAEARAWCRSNKNMPPRRASFMEDEDA